MENARYQLSYNLKRGEREFIFLPSHADETISYYSWDGKFLRVPRWLPSPQNLRLHLPGIRCKCEICVSRLAFYFPRRISESEGEEISIETTFSSISFYISRKNGATCSVVNLFRSARYIRRSVGEARDESEIRSRKRKHLWKCDSARIFWSKEDGESFTLEWKTKNHEVY